MGGEELAAIWYTISPTFRHFLFSRYALAFLVKSKTFRQKRLANYSFEEWTCFLASFIINAGT
jgi:hypothetical protein